MLKRQFLSKLISKTRLLQMKFFSSDREQIPYDVCIVGGGIAGLSTAIKLKQLSQTTNKPISICVLEKGSEIGSHVLSGNVFEPVYFKELFPEIDLTKNPPSPLNQPVFHDEFHILLNKIITSVKVPEIFMPGQIHNHGNYVISLGLLCKWLAEKAIDLEVDVFTGFAADKLRYDESYSFVTGVVLKDFGVAKNGQPKPEYQQGAEIIAPITIIAEGARGSLASQAINHFKLDKLCSPQTYGLGIKEVWEVDKDLVKAGQVLHTVGYPTFNEAYSGGFLYTTWDSEAGLEYLQNPNIKKPSARYIHAGYVVGLDYRNPYLNPYEEFQLWKNSKLIRPFLEKGKVIKYGARVINEGGYNAIPKLSFPGGILVGCSAGFLNVMKIKGSHNAMKSGMVAAESIMNELVTGNIEFGNELVSYERNMKESPVFEELRQTKDFRASFKTKTGESIIDGLLGGAIISLTKGRFDLFDRETKTDTQYTEKAIDHKKIEYPKHDGKISFDILDSVARSGTHHEHDQPSHLKIKPDGIKSWKKSEREFAGMEGRLNRTVLSG